MNLRVLARVLAAASILHILPLANAQGKDKPQPQVTIDLKPLGAAPDLFSDQSDSKYPQRGIINLFWLGNDRIAVAFSTTQRWSKTEKPEPLHVRLIVFDAQGKQQHTRDWDFGAEGPESQMTLDLAPGPNESILAIHQSTSTNKIPDGDFLQVLNADTSLRQNFYIPATSDFAPSVSPVANLVLESYYANKHTSFAWWSGNPFRPGPKLDLPPAKSDILVGPEVAARADCANPELCFGLRVYRVNKPAWYYSLPQPDLVPLPRVFLSTTALVVELRPTDKKQGDLVVLHTDGPPTPLPALPHNQQVVGATSVSTDGRRFALTTVGEIGICGPFSIWCNERGQALVIDVPGNRIVFQQEISASGGASSLSPDGKRLATFDRDKLAVYSLP